LAPVRRASDRPIAIACLRLLTVRPERPLLSVPRFISRITRPTFLLLERLYRRAMQLPPGCQKADGEANQDGHAGAHADGPPRLLMHVAVTR